MNQESLQLTGANTIRKDRSSVDFYPTPPAATHALMKFMRERNIIPLTGTVWEPAAGDGAMVRVIEKYGYQVVATDINIGTDFLNCPEPTGPIDAIITNPPFSLANEFIATSLRRSKIVALLFKAQFWHGKRRRAIFMSHPPSFVLPLTWRVDFLNGAKGGRPTMDVAWSIWSPDHKESCQYFPLAKP